MTTYSICASGSSGSAALVDLSALATAVPEPKSRYQPYSQMLPLSSGSVRGGGWAAATWSWGFLTRAQRDQLRTFCPAASSDVWIRTRTMDSDDAYQVYRGIMVWPVEQEEKDAGRRINFEITFQRLRTS